MKVYGLVVFLSFIVCPIFAQRDQQFNGTCPAVTTQARFNESQYAGVWYEIKSFNNTLIPGDCGVPKYVLSGNGYSVTYASRNLTQNRNYTTQIVLKKQVINPLAGRYDVYVNNRKEPIPHFVLETDYKTYSVVFGCVYNSASRRSTQRAFIYSRQKTLSQASLNNALNALRRFKIDDRKLRNVQQDDKKCTRKRGMMFLYFDDLQ